MGKSTISMTISNSYVSLPEGISGETLSRILLFFTPEKLGPHPLVQHGCCNKHPPEISHQLAMMKPQQNPA